MGRQVSKPWPIENYRSSALDHRYYKTIETNNHRPQNGEKKIVKKESLLAVPTDLGLKAELFLKN
jgi:hypothetical protein